MRERTPPARPAPPLSRHALRAEPVLPPRERFWNAPNTITVLRAGVVPILLLLPLFPGETGSTVIAWIFIVAAVSDLLDGWLARRGKMVTHVGPSNSTRFPPAPMSWSFRCSTTSTSAKGTTRQRCTIRSSFLDPYGGSAKATG